MTRGGKAVGNYLGLNAEVCTVVGEPGCEAMPQKQKILRTTLNQLKILQKRCRLRHSRAVLEISPLHHKFGGVEGRIFFSVV